LVGGKDSKGSISVTIRVPVEIIKLIKKKSKKYRGRSGYIRKLIMRDLRKS